MRIIFQPARFKLPPLVMIAALCIPASLLAEDHTAEKTPTPPPNQLDPHYPLPLPPLAVMLAFRDAVLSAANPPTLEDRLAAAEQLLQERTAAAAPLVEAMSKAEAELAPAQAALAAAEQEAAALQKSIDALAAEVDQITESRATSEAERAKLATTLVKLQEAQPLVAEALRHLTEAVGKAPTDTTLTEAHRQLTEKLKAMEMNVADLQKKANDLAAAVAAADGKLKDSNARLDAARQQSAAFAERVATLQSDTAKLTTALEAAGKAAQPAQSAVAQAQREVEHWKNEIAFRDQMAALEVELAAARILADQRQAELDKVNQQLAAAQSAADTAAAQLAETSRSIDAIHAKIQSAHRLKRNQATETTEITETKQ